MFSTLIDCPVTVLLRSHGVDYYTDARGLWAREDILCADGKQTIEWVLLDAMDRDAILGWLGYGEADLDPLC